MRVCAVGDEFMAEALEFGFEGFGVLDDLFLVGFEVWGHGLLQGNREGGNGVVVGATLMAREDGEVDGAFKVVEDRLAGFGISAADAFTEEDHGTSRATERFVGGGGDYVGVLEGCGDDFGGDEARDMGHVDYEVGSYEVGNLAHALVVDESAVCRSACYQALWSVHERILFQSVIVDYACVDVHSVRESLEVGGNSRNPGDGQQTGQVSSLESLLTSSEGFGIRG